MLTHHGLAMTAEWMFAPEIASGEVKGVLTDWDLPPGFMGGVADGQDGERQGAGVVEYVESLLTI